MNKTFLTAVLLLCSSNGVFAAQAALTQIQALGSSASIKDLRDATNTRFAAAQSNFGEIYTALNGSPWLAQTTAPNVHNVFWIDTSGALPTIKYWDGDSWEVAASGGDGTYTLPTASAETKGGVKIGARLTMTGEVLSADVQTTDISGKQDILVSGTNIKTVNGTSVLGSGNLVVGDGGGIAHATSDGVYYASRNGAWASLAGIFASPLGADDNYVADAEKIKLGNLSGTNTGDQDLSGYVLTSSVLSKTNTTAFTPTADYHPATKKYVDDSITASGGYTDEQAQDAAGAMFSGNTETGITAVYDDATGKINLTVPTSLSAFSEDDTHRLATDIQIAIWNAKQNALVAGTDYLAPTGIGASLTFTATGFNGNLATTINTVQELADAVDDLPVDSDDQTAAEVPITDSGGYYTATTVEGALAERGADPLIHWDTATITEVENSPVAGTNTISVKAGVFQAYDADMIAWPAAISATEVQYLDGLPDTLVNLLGGKQAADGDLTDLADGSLTGSKVAGYAAATTSKATTYTIGTDSISESYGGTVYVTSATTITAPAVTAGMNFSVVTVGDIAVSLDVNADDKMILDGVTLADGDKATNSSKSGDTIVCQYYSVDGWYCWSGTVLGGHWTDGN